MYKVRPERSCTAPKGSLYVFRNPSTSVLDDPQHLHHMGSNRKYDRFIGLYWFPGNYK